jgi:hypothetical protein
MSLQVHPCALSHYKVELPPLPYASRLGFSRLHEELEACEAKDIVGKYSFNFHGERSSNLGTEELENLRWLLTPWMTFYEPFDKAMAISLPFTFEFIHAHPSVEKRFVDPETKMIKAHAFIPPEIMQKERALHVIRLILERVYGIKDVRQIQVVFVHNDETLGLPEFHAFTFDERFIEVEVLGGEPPKLDQNKLNELKMNPGSNLEAWLELFPVDRFAFKGFSMISTSEVTTQEALAGLHRELQQGTIIDKKRLANLQTYFQIFTRAPELTLRIYIPRKDNILLLAPSSEGNPGCMLSNSIRIPVSDLDGSRFEEVLLSEEQIWCDDQTHLTPVVLSKIQQPFNPSCLLIPLRENDDTIGVLELTLNHQQDLLRANSYVYSEMIQTISQALRRSMVDLQQRIQSVIQTHCTALHPSVVWRFEAEARKFLEREGSANFSDIVFNKVYPLYSQSDIQSSSAFRNEAIRTDLNMQLDLATVALNAMNEDHPMPIYGEMLFRIQERRERLKGELQSSDELAIQQFLNLDVESLFNDLGKENQPSFQAIQSYRDQLDPKYGMVHQERGRYEKAVTQINQWIQEKIENEQVSAQAMIPHYSEKVSTDGVELSLYLGKSLLNRQDWSELHLRNLRLWQLILTCRIARHCEQVVDDLELPLRMTHLILVQDMPLTIRFSTEEKAFAVDGAYNIRYEIMKKRIDKATIAGTENERLTQAGMVAVVYSHSGEAEMYRGFFKYLQDMALIGPEVEDHALEALQGLTGLRALRVQVIPDRRAVSRGPDPDIASSYLEPQP